MRRDDDMTQLAQDRQIEANVWRGRCDVLEAENVHLREALRQIAEAEVVLTGDIINVARQALDG
jgi:hypothetical protein